MCTTAILIGPRILLGNGNVSLTHALDLGSWEESNGLGAKFSASYHHWKKQTRKNDFVFGDLAILVPYSTFYWVQQEYVNTLK